MTDKRIGIVLAKINSIRPSNRLTFRLASIVLTVALTIGLMLSLAQILLDYQEEKQSISGKIEEILASVKPAAEVAVYEIDSVLTNEIASGLLENGAIIRVTIHDNLAGLLADVSRPHSRSQFEWLTRLLFGDHIEKSLPLRDVKRRYEIIGELKVVLDPNHFTSNFLRRASYVFISGIIRNTILALVTFILLYYLLTKPLLRLTNEISDIGLQKDGRKTLSLPKGHENDELGRLVHVFNDLSHALQSSQEILHRYNKGLEDEIVQEKSLSLLKDEFLAMVSHELRTPINGISGALELLLDELEPPLADSKDKTKIDSAHQYIETALNAKDQLTSIVEDILTYSDLKAGALEIKPKDTNIKTLLQSIIDESCRLENSEVAVSCEIVDHLPAVVQVDSSRLATIITHLLKNAIHHTNKGEVKLIAALENNPSQKSQAILTISVFDTGVGITEANQQKIWEVFRQIDGSFSRTNQGLGIGLPLCKALLGCMQGQIKITSKPHQGTKVTITLPVSLTDKNAISEQENSPQPITGKSIFVVEDNATNLMILERMLAKLGCETISASNGQVAIELLEQDQPKLDAILMDCQMPVMDGFETTRKIRMMAPYIDTPIIAVTANVGDSERARCIESGMNDHLGKPISSYQVNQILHYWLGDKTQ